MVWRRWSRLRRTVRRRCSCLRRRWRKTVMRRWWRWWRRRKRRRWRTMRRFASAWRRRRCRCRDRDLFVRLDTVRIHLSGDAHEPGVNHGPQGLHDHQGVHGMVPALGAHVLVLLGTKARLAADPRTLGAVHCIPGQQVTGHALEHGGHAGQGANEGREQLGVQKVVWNTGWQKRVSACRYWHRRRRWRRRRHLRHRRCRIRVG